MRKWKYETLFNCKNDELDKMGLDGWELINIYKESAGSNLIIFIFKQEL
jgi:hypothetical protein